MQKCSNLWEEIKEQIYRGGDDTKQSYRPKLATIKTLMEHLKGILFCNIVGVAATDDLESCFSSSYRILREEVNRACKLNLLEPRDESVDHIDSVISRFFNALPDIQRSLEDDIDAAFRGDPSIFNKIDVITSLPSLNALAHYRVAHLLYVLGVPTLPRFMSFKAQGESGIDIHPGAKIGRGVFMDHGTGIVIGETAVIGDNVRIYQGVTLGAKNFPKDQNGQLKKGLPRHPIVGSDVVIYAGATILGRISIGNEAIIGGNVWVTKDIPDKARVSQTPYREYDFNQGAGI
tara:strand:+ start:919 stop:1788 length:870 start_codon:yes stop_codon:yes gene_type:complete